MGEVARVKLFRAWSVVDDFKGHDGAVFHWFCPSREKPVAPCEDSSLHTGDLDHSISGDRIREAIDSLLTAKEVDELRDYLHSRYQLEVQAAEEISPELSPAYLTDVFPNEMRRFHRLPDDLGYKLSLPIWGYYDLKTCPETLAMIPEQNMIGIQFANRLLLKLGLPESDRLTEIVEAIYDETGLHVASGKSRSERLAAKEDYLRRGPAATGRAEIPRPDIRIHLNNCGCDVTCPLCGGTYEPRTGPELFLADTHQPVCESCAELFSPDLLSMVETLRRVRDKGYRKGKLDSWM